MPSFSLMNNHFTYDNSKNYTYKQTDVNVGTIGWLGLTLPLGISAFVLCYDCKSFGKRFRSLPTFLRAREA